MQHGSPTRAQVRDLVQVWCRAAGIYDGIRGIGAVRAWLLFGQHQGDEARFVTGGAVRCKPVAYSAALRHTEAHTDAMDELARIEAVRLQRRATDAAIQQTEAWAKAHRDQHPNAFGDMVTLYVYSLGVDTVDELADIEAQAHAYLQRLQGAG